MIPQRPFQYELVTLFGVTAVCGVLFGVMRAVGFDRAAVVQIVVVSLLLPILGIVWIASPRNRRIVRILEYRYRKRFGLAIFALAVSVLAVLLLAYLMSVIGK